MSGTPEASGQRGDSLREGDPTTGVIDIANELAYMVPGIRGEDHAGEKKEMARATTWSHLEDHLTHLVPLGEVSPRLADHPARISGVVESGPPFQCDSVYGFGCHLPSVRQF